MIKYKIDMLIENSVSVEKQEYIDMNGIEYAIGQPDRKAYANSVRGREEIINELPLVQQNAIFAVWGDTPTVDESVTD